ncbi:MAG TPA: hypothetical protein QKA14_00715 [Candidatus Megaira endosymbiont of Hartmannula sinica]|nr:hypothetical protein [Candidatus Megaera endosymbiont of Hartmannula sinica]
MLHIGADNLDQNLIDLAIQYDPNSINYQNEYGYNPINVISEVICSNKKEYSKSMSIIRIFYNMNVDINNITNINTTPLKTFALIHDFKKILLVLKLGADIELKDKSNLNLFDWLQGHDSYKYFFSIREYLCKKHKEIDDVIANNITNKEITIHPGYDRIQMNGQSLFSKIVLSEDYLDINIKPEYNEEISSIESNLCDYEDGFDYLYDFDDFNLYDF